MALHHVSAVFRNQSRIRLFFDSELAGPSFNAALYAVETPGHESPAIAVRAALAVIGSANAVELVLDQELLSDVVYRATLSASVEGSNGTLGVETVVDIKTPGQAESARPSRSVVPDVYGEDIRWIGDWLETADGDLAIQSGLQNLKDAVINRALSEGIVWSRAYGLRARRYVDAPPALPTLAIEAGRQALLDDRLTAARGVASADTVEIIYTPVGARSQETATVGR